MKKQIQSIIICMLMSSSAIIIIPRNVESVVIPPPPEQLPETPGQELRPIDELDYPYIYQITDWLSWVIKRSYDPQIELAKGRGFGSKGERDASLYLYNEMTDDLKLSNTKIEQINITPPTNFKFYIPQIQFKANRSSGHVGHAILSQFDVSSFSLTLNEGTTKQTSYDTSEFFITPYWGWLFPFQWELYDGQPHTYGGDDAKIQRGGKLVNFILTIMIKHAPEISQYVLENDPDLNETCNFIISLIEQEYDFSMEDIDPDNPATIPRFWDDMECPPIGDPDPFVIISEDFWNNLKNPLDLLFYDLGNPYSKRAFGWHSAAIVIPQIFCRVIYRDCFKGSLIYDFDGNDNVHDLPALAWSPFPVICVNGDWKYVKEHWYDYSIDFSLTETFNYSSISSNVIGEIPGQNPSKTILVDCLYDGKWSSATADSAIGMGVVMAIAKEMKYLADPPYNIKPKYTIKFVAFSGEEDGNRGAYYYERNHSSEEIIDMIDLNQIGFTERENHLTLNVFMNNKEVFSKKIENLTEETNYHQRVGGVSDFKVNNQEKIVSFGDFFPFVDKREDMNMMCFLEDTGWSLHHRSGGNEYQYGDVIDYYNDEKVRATASMVWNLTKYLAYNHNASFDDTAPQTYSSIDVDGDGSMDSIKATFTVNTVLPHDRVTVRAKLFGPSDQCKMITRKDFDVKYFSKRCTLTFTLPPIAQAGYYRIDLELLNGTERIEDKLFRYNDPDHLVGKANDTITSGLSYFYLTPRGNTKPEAPTFSIEGNGEVHILEKRNYIANSIDANNDQLAYYIQWDSYDAPIFYPYQIVVSDENAYFPHQYLSGGLKTILVQSREKYVDWSIWNPWGESSDYTHFYVYVRWIPSLIESQNSLYSSESFQATANQPTNIFSVNPLNYQPSTYLWTITGEGRETEHYYTKNLTYNFTDIGITTVNLTMTDTLGNQIYAEVPMTVSNLTARFITNRNHSAENNETLFFNDTSTGVNNITSWVWNFGDGTNATSAPVNHTYLIYGDYNVTLTIHDNKSNTSVYQKTIRVNHDLDPPTLSNLSYEFLQNNSQPVILLTASVQDPDRGVDIVKVNITSPTGEHQNTTMHYYINNIYYLYYINITTSGDYTYAIWTVDNANNTNTTTPQVFKVPSIFGYLEMSDKSVSVKDRITGSNFTIPEYGKADSITALLHIDANQIPAKAQAMIYRANDSTLIGTSNPINLASTSSPIWVTFNITDPKPILKNDTDYILALWCNKTCTLNYTISTNRGRYYSSTYNGAPPQQPTFTIENKLCSIYCSYIPDAPAEINNVTATPMDVGCGLNLTITTDITDPISGINSVNISIAKPDNTTENHTVTPPGSGNKYTYTFTSTNQLGTYHYTIWVTDNSLKTNTSTNYTFISHPKPYADFDTPPTPANNTNQTLTWMKVNVTVQDNLNTSGFLDWNHALRGYWPMDSYNSTGVNDNSTFDNFGRFYGGMNTSNIKTGKYGKALEFDGQNDNVDLGANNSLHLGTGDFTFMVWEKSHVIYYPYKAVLFTNRPEDASAKGFCFGINNNKPYLYATQSSGNNVTLTGRTVITNNQWHHIAFVRKGTNYSIYVDSSYDAGITGAAKNITNNQHTYFSYGRMPTLFYFDGLLDEPQLYNRALIREEINASFNNKIHKLTHNFTGLTDAEYEVYAHEINTPGNQSTTQVRHIAVDTKKPAITSVTASPHTVGFGGGININASITDSGSGVEAVFMNITYPSGFWQNYTMTYMGGTTYRYMFYDAWITGQYNYTVSAVDHAGNMNSSTGHHFHVSAEAQISIATLKNSYTGNQSINITDPPNPPDNLTLINRGFTWNTYYNASSGDNILESYQAPVNYQDDNGSWLPINNTIQALASDYPAYSYGYRFGDDRGLFGVYFKPDAQNNWPVAFAYNRSDDPTINVIRSKLVGIGYVDPASNWSYQYLQSVQTSQGQIHDNAVIYQGVFAGTDVTWSYGNIGLKEAITLSNTTKTLLQNHPPSQYGLHDASSYLVFITKMDHPSLNLYNDSGILTGNVTISEKGVDFKDTFGQFKCALPLGEAYELNNESLRQKLTYRIVHLNGNTYLLSGLKVSALNAMTFPVVIDPTLSVYSLTNDGYIFSSSSNYNTAWNASSGTVDSSSTFLTFGQKKVASFPPTYYIYRSFLLFNTSSLPSNAYIDNATLSLYKKDDYSTTDFTITMQNGKPTYPHNPLQTGDYAKSHYAGNGGGLNTSQLVNGRNEFGLTNLSWINKTGLSKLCLRSSRDINGMAPTGNEYVNVYSSNALDPNPNVSYKPKLIISYRNQSKIKNTGTINIKGYLLLQIQFYNTSQGKWVVNWDVDNETLPRTINSSSQLGLDTMFNGLIRASDLSYGAGTYRVYAALRDPSGDVLKTSSGVELKACWQFTTNVGT